MKIHLDISKEKYEEIKEYLLSKDFEIDENAEYVLTENEDLCIFINCKKEDETFSIAIKDIVFCESMGHYVYVHTKDDVFKLCERLWQIGKLLGTDKFMRISNSVIICKKKIKYIKAALSQKFVLTMINDEKVEVTRSYYYLFKNEFGI